MRRRTFLALGAAPLAGRAAERRPNVLLILPDQLRAQALGVMGNRDVRSPHIDRLAAEGLLFRQTLANTPVCCPARANILTGKYAHRNGMVANDLRLRESQPTMPQAFHDAGYRTGFIGKWHLDGGKRQPGFVPPGPRRHGFEFWAANECNHSHFHTQYFRDTSQPIPIERFEPEAWVDLGVEFLRGSQRDTRPFFLTVQMGPPHDPYKAPPEFARLYDPAKLEMRPNWRGGPGLPGRQDLAQYYGMITAADAQIGRLLAELDRLGMREDTIVLLTSDHGDMLGSQGRRLKRKPWEESIRVPGILRYPRQVRPGRTSDCLFTHVDLAPTLLALCGVQGPDGMQGTNLSKVVLGRESRGPDSAFFQIFGPYQGDGTEDGWRGVRTARYMYARFESKPWVLFDLEKDPYEMRNLVDEPGARGLVAEMERRLAGWIERTGDSWRYDWHELVEDNGRLYRHETFYTVDEYLAWAKQHPEAEKAN
ncbi:MAG TPA: sulfatase [Bryobacteraceae bacterium]|nr:sulfatase [Bryobacteraceae bacterium]